MLVFSDCLQFSSVVSLKCKTLIQKAPVTKGNHHFVDTKYKKIHSINFFIDCMPSFEF